MKKILNKSLLFIALLGVMFTMSCTKELPSVDPTQASKSTVVPVLVASNTASQVLTVQNQANLATSLSWTSVWYGVNTPITYTIQYDSAGKNFVTFNESSTSGFSMDLNQKTLNAFGKKAGIVVGTNGSVEFRIKASIGTTGSMPVYSNVLVLTFTTYDDLFFQYVPGDYQGWSPGSAPKLASADVNADFFEGYINVPAGGTFEFKITPNPDWSTAYGVGATAGTLSTSGGNLKWPSSDGYYRVNDTISKLTWTADKTTWGIIGDFNGWSTDVPLTYDVTNKVWTASNVALTAGSFKFRANADWGNPLHNFGINSIGALDYNSKTNIPVLVSGNYNVTLDLSHPMRYTYTLVKI